MPFSSLDASHWFNNRTSERSVSAVDLSPAQVSILTALLAEISPDTYLFAYNRATGETSELSASDADLFFSDIDYLIGIVNG